MREVFAQQRQHDDDDDDDDVSVNNSKKKKQPNLNQQSDIGGLWIQILVDKGLARVYND